MLYTTQICCELFEVRSNVIHLFIYICHLTLTTFKFLWTLCFTAEFLTKLAFRLCKRNLFYLWRELGGLLNLKRRVIRRRLWFLMLISIHMSYWLRKFKIFLRLSNSWELKSAICDRCWKIKNCVPNILLIKNYWHYIRLLLEKLYVSWCQIGCCCLEWIHWIYIFLIFICISGLANFYILLNLHMLVANWIIIWIFI